MRISQECSQKWYRLSSWRRWDSNKKRYVFDGYRKLNFGIKGFAIGPIIFWFN